MSVLSNLTAADIAIATFIIGLIAIMHKQAMSKFDKLIETVGVMSQTMAVHDEKLSSGNAEFSKIESHQKDQDLLIADLILRVSKLEIVNDSK